MISSEIGWGSGRKAGSTETICLRNGEFWWQMGTGDGGELLLTDCPGRLGLMTGSSLCGGRQHVVGRLGLTGQGHAPEPDWYCVGRDWAWACSEEEAGKGK